MDALTTAAWAAITAVTAWGLTRARAAAAISRIRKEMLEEVHHWQAESARAKARAAQLANDIAAWTAGCKQGRDDLVTVLPLIIAALQPSSHPVVEDTDYPTSR